MSSDNLSLKTSGHFSQNIFQSLPTGLQNTWHSYLLKKKKVENFEMIKRLTQQIFCVTVGKPKDMLPCTLKRHLGTTHRTMINNLRTRLFTQTGIFRNCGLLGGNCSWEYEKLVKMVVKIVSPN